MYTKGKWRLNNYHHPYQYIVSHGDDNDNDAFPGQRKICDIWDWNTKKGKVNACLIAAAPDLLAACERMRRRADTGKSITQGDIDILEAAIAKAKPLQT